MRPDVAEVTRLLWEAAAVIGEAPVRLGMRTIWTDPVQRNLHVLGDDGAREVVAVDRSIWSLGVTPEGELVGATDDGFAALEEAQIKQAGPTADLLPGCRFNDMTVAPDGVLWVGAMHRGILATRGAIYRAASIASKPERVAEGLGVPNGMAISIDGNRLFVIDTLSRTLLSYPIEDASLGEPVIVTDFLDLPGKPDGMALAPNGVFHVAMWGGGCVAHIAPDGATLGSTSVPAPHVSSVCDLGDGRLFVTTSRMRLSPDRLEAFPQSGGAFEISGAMAA